MVPQKEYQYCIQKTWVQILTLLNSSVTLSNIFFKLILSYVIWEFKKILYYRVVIKIKHDKVKPFTIVPDSPFTLSKCLFQQVTLKTELLHCLIIIFRLNTCMLGNVDYFRVVIKLTPLILQIMWGIFQSKVYRRVYVFLEESDM